MSRRRQSHSETPVSSSTMNETMTSPYASTTLNNVNHHHVQPQPHAQRHRRGPIEGPDGRRLVRRVTWRSSTYKLMASLWVLGMLYIVWLIRDVLWLPFSPYPEASQPKDHDPQDYLAQYVGRKECGFSSRDLYYNPHESGRESDSSNMVCQTRASLLDAMNNGGRQVRDAPYRSHGCQYRWYSPVEICEILGKLGSVSFIGDESIAHVYAAFNILLRQNLLYGSLKEWDMSNDQIWGCQCDSQFTRDSCFSYRITASDDVRHPLNPPATHSPYVCSRALNHAFLAVDGSPSPLSAQEKFAQLVAHTEGKTTPIVVILGLSFSDPSSTQTALATMDEWAERSQQTGRNASFLWVGPTAAYSENRHVDEHGRQIARQFALKTTEAARRRTMDVLNMFNATSLATSWDGRHYGERISLLQAMMIVNWLSTL